MAGGAAELHALGIPDPPGRLVRVLEVKRPALVLGSTQDTSVADAAACAALGVDVVRRRSGGGAVLVEPGRLVWVDVVVPAGDPLWCDDVGHAFVWLGQAWARALAGSTSLGGSTGSVRVHTAGLVYPNRWSRLVCFAGVGPGEVVGDGDGAKVVGMAQRRTRAGALFQCAVPLAWEPYSLLALTSLSADDRRRAGAELSGAVVPLCGATTQEVVAALVAELPL
ncbi:MAG: hypothetical protein KY439_03890 [Actinobacteria bacterium]|nr:hypothetical protein [Actinomycetota bacterium]